MSERKSTYTLTPNQLAKWQEIRKDTVSEFLPNPKTENGHPKIKRDGETFKKIENLYEKRKLIIGKIDVDESKAALPKEDLEKVLALTLQHSAYSKDSRTASKISMINKNLNASYKRLVRSNEVKRGILLDPLTTKELVMQSFLNYYYPSALRIKPAITELTLNEPTDDVIIIMMQQFMNRIKYIRNITRKYPLTTHIKSLKTMQSPLKEETVDSVINNFKKKYTKESTLNFDIYEKDIIINDTLEKFTKLYNKDTNAIVYSLSPIEQKLKNNILNYYDITEPIAIFYTCYIISYINRYINNILTLNQSTIPVWARIIRLSITESTLSYLYNNYSVITKIRLESLIEDNNIKEFKKYLNNGLDQNFMYLVEGKLISIIDILKDKKAIKFIELIKEYS